MRENDISRRNFLISATSSTAFCVVGGTQGSGAQAVARTLRLGGPIFVKSSDPEILAKAHRDLGYRAAYAPEVSISDRQGIDAITQAFAKHDVTIAEVGAWANLLDVDPQKRKKNFSYVSERLAIADELGALCCVDLAGSYNPMIWYGPDARNITQEFQDATVENVRKLVDNVKPQRTKFSIEMSPWNIPTGPEEYLNLIKAVDRKAFAAHIDITNIINSPYRMYRNGEVIQDCLEKLAPWVVSCHGKDLKWEVGLPDTVRFRETVPGKGMIDFKSCLRAMSRLPNDVPLMIEHLASELEYTEGRRYIQNIASSMGLSFGPAGEGTNPEGGKS